MRTGLDLDLLPPVRPYRGLRAVDAWGAGAYQAARGDHMHMGLDFLADAGDAIVTPCPGIISHVGVAYLGSDLGSLHLDGMGQYGDFRLKLLYVKPHVDTTIGSVFAAGDSLGLAQSVAGYWQAQHPGRGPMSNHCHMEVRVNGMLVDPALHVLFPPEAA